MPQSLSGLPGLVLFPIPAVTDIQPAVFPIDPGIPGPDQGLIQAHFVDRYQGDSPSVPVPGYRIDLYGFLPDHAIGESFGPVSESLSLFRSVDAIQAYSDGFIVVQNLDGVTIGDPDNLVGPGKGGEGEKKKKGKEKKKKKKAEEEIHVFFIQVFSSPF